MGKKKEQKKKEQKKKEQKKKQKKKEKKGRKRPTDEELRERYERKRKYDQENAKKNRLLAAKTLEDLKAKLKDQDGQLKTCKLLLKAVDMYYARHKLDGVLEDEAVCQLVRQYVTRPTNK